MASALIIGGSGQIGRAVAARLLQAGWLVTCAQRDPDRLSDLPALAGARSVRLDREAPGALAAAVAGGFDAVIDTVAFTEAHARQLLEIQADVGTFVVISSGSVYCDAAGRTLDEADERGFPEFPAAIPESQPTVDPGPATYSTRKVALEQTLLQTSDRPVTILRPFAIHGEGTGHCREWFFVKRMLDGRTRIPLAYGGGSRFQTTASTNIAELVRLCLAAPAGRVLNVADSDAPGVGEIGLTIARLYGAAPAFVGLDGPPRRGVGDTPWSVAGPIIADQTAAPALGFTPTSYAERVEAACRAAEARAAAGLSFMGYLNGMFDYAAEDRLLDA